MVEKKFIEMAVDISNVSSSYNKIKAPGELSLQLSAGISFGLLGIDSAGKTTLIRLLAGLPKRKSGDVEILGQPPSGKTAHRIGYMP